jgi:DNA-binding Lrp family transcriptional regulator
MALKILNFEAHKVPTFKEARGKDWILFGDEGEYKNRYPEYLLNLYRRSAKHHAIINSKKDYVVGQGWAVNAEGLDTMGLARLQQFIQEPNQYESLNDILEKVALDYELYNGFALEVVYNQLNDKIAAIYHADFARYRSNEDGTKYYYSEDWKKHNPVVEEIDAFNWKEPSGKQLLYVKGYSPDCKYYPLPTYLGSTGYIDLDIEIQNYHISAVRNNFVVSSIISFHNGTPTLEEQEEIERQIKDKFTGTDNAGSFVLNFADSRDRGIDIQRLNGNDDDKRFDILNKTVQREIYAGHSVTDPALFGIKEDGIFTSRNQLVDSFELFQNTYVNGRQQFIERVFNDLAAIQGLSNRLFIQDTEPISIQFSENTVVSVMTQEEIREKIGLPKLEQPLQAAKTSNDEDSILVEYFKNCGSIDYEPVGNGKALNFESETSARLHEELNRKYWFAEIDPLDTAILNILKENPATPFLAIAEQLQLSIERVIAGLQRLNEANAIKIAIDNVLDSTQRAVEVTKEGERLLEQIPPVEEEFVIRYVYAKRPGVDGADIIPTTREFCRKLIELVDKENRTWTLTEIQDIGVSNNRNVWMRGGGFWGKSYHCRHYWEQKLMRIKK